GIDIKGMPTHKVNRLGIARTFQNIRLFTDMTALDNVKVGMHHAIKCSFLSSLLHLPSYYKAEKKANEKAMELLDFMGLADVADVKAGSLPYGVQRRLEIVRALATNPSIILLDEPAAGMNPSETTELMHQIRRIRDTFHIAIFLIEHDMNLVMNVCEAIAVVNYGRLIAKGTPEEIRANPAVIEAYLGKEDSADAEN
ncbi:MAG: ABC transporter ATP-binding protein, partial [Clostridiales bacterium]|nr:ABC transporter ATP-binding protein [Clostridiales bacterium]